MTYDQFWLRYLRAHSRPKTRALHYAGTVLALATLLIAVVTLNWRGLIAAPLIGYSFAWTAYFAIERNRPETFGHPLNRPMVQRQVEPATTPRLHWYLPCLTIFPNDSVACSAASVVMDASPKPT